MLKNKACVSHYRRPIQEGSSDYEVLSDYDGTLLPELMHDEYEVLSNYQQQQQSNQMTQQSYLPPSHPSSSAIISGITSAADSSHYKSKTEKRPGEIIPVSKSAPATDDATAAMYPLFRSNSPSSSLHTICLH